MASGAAVVKSAEKYPAQRQQPERLPEAEHSEAEQWGQQPVPQVHYDFAADEGK